jgi:4-hydroxy-3-methylbut-2-enyl diphosphate reductase IspH
VFSNPDKEVDRLGDMTMLVLRSIGIANMDGKVQGDLLEVVLLNQACVDITATSSRVQQGVDREFLVVVRGKALHSEFRKLRSSKDVDFRHVQDTIRQF